MSLVLNHQQYEAANACYEWWKSINRKQVFEIVGPAGSGKTTIVKVLMEKIGLRREEVLFMAYVGKATQALAMKGNFAKTVHSSIYDVVDIPRKDDVGNFIVKSGRFVTRKGFVKKEGLPEGVRLIVLDEGGMIDPRTAADILSFGIPVLVLGDLDQLPPIFGNSFFLRYPDVILTEVMRQKADSPILWLADRARKNQELPIGTYDNCRVIAKEDLTDSDLFNPDMIITGKNATRDNLNSYIRKSILKVEDYVPLIYGDKIVCRQNNWKRNLDDNIYLINGMVGYVDAIDLSSYSQHSLSIDFRPDFEDFRTFNNVQVDLDFLARPAADKEGGFSRYDKFQFAYAITCHMSQGSQYHDVLYYQEHYGSKDFMRRLNYTAITRAEEILTIAV